MSQVSKHEYTPPGRAPRESSEEDILNALAAVAAKESHTATPADAEHASPEKDPTAETAHVAEPSSPGPDVDPPEKENGHTAAPSGEPADSGHAEVEQADPAPTKMAAEDHEAAVSDVHIVDPQATVDAQAQTHETEAAHGAHEEHTPSPMSVSPKMVGWTWLTFAIVAFVLYKYAWKPILQGLDDREAKIRKSIEDAEEIQRTMDALEERREKAIDEADAKAKAIVDDARKAAVDAGHAIEAKARQEAEILYENTLRDIRTEKDKAAVGLRREAAELAVSLASKILTDELSAERQNELTQQLIKDL